MSHNYIDVPDAPEMDGLRFRQFAGESDYAEMAPMLNEAFEGRGDYWTVEAVRHLDSFVPWIDPAKDRLIAEVHGRMIGAGRVEARQTAQGERMYFHSFNMLPSWRGKGIGTAVLKHNERRLREIAAAHPSDGPRYFQAFPVMEHQVATERLLKRHRYEAVRYINELVRANLDDIPNSPPPAGIELRPIRDSDMRAIWRTKEEAFLDLWCHCPQQERDFTAWCSDPFLRKDLSNIAFDGEQCVGTTMVFVLEEENRKKNRKCGYTELIAVRRPWRRRGIARAMIARCLSLLKDADFELASLSVDTQSRSGALKLYESMGYEVERRSTFFRKPMD